MVYMGNIVEVHENLLEGEVLLLFYKSGRNSTLYYDDKLQRFHGDLKVTRIVGKENIKRKMCIVIDCAEVESICVSEEVNFV